MSYERVAGYAPVRALGEVCGPCMIQSGSDCEICPDGASDDFPECAGCVNGLRPSVVSAAEQSILFPVVAGVLTTLIVAYLSVRLIHQKSS